MELKFKSGTLSTLDILEKTEELMDMSNLMAEKRNLTSHRQIIIYLRIYTCMLQKINSTLHIAAD
jgi:hypothetical protein